MPFFSDGYSGDLAPFLIENRNSADDLAGSKVRRDLSSNDLGTGYQMSFFDVVKA